MINPILLHAMCWAAYSYYAMYPDSTPEALIEFAIMAADGADYNWRLAWQNQWFKLGAIRRVNGPWVIA